jgi:hypothetical protein
MLGKPNPASAAAQTGSGDYYCHRLAAFDALDTKTALSDYQARILARRFRLRRDRARLLVGFAFPNGGRRA